MSVFDVVMVFMSVADVVVIGMLPCVVVVVLATGTGIGMTWVFFTRPFVRGISTICCEHDPLGTTERE